MEIHAQKLIHYLQEEHPELFEEILNEQWSVCVIESKLLSGMTLTELLRLVLIEEPSGSWHTFDGDLCKFQDNQINLHNTDFTIKSKEKYYSEDGRHCCLLILSPDCMEPVQGDFRNSELSAEHPNTITFASIIEVEISRNKKVRNKLECFKKRLKPNKTGFKSIDDLAKEFYKLFEFILKMGKTFARKKKMKNGSGTDNDTTEGVVETFLFRELQPEIMETISCLYFSDDATLNKIRRNLCHLTPEQMHVRDDMTDQILQVRRSLNMLPNFLTPSDKQSALWRAFKTFSEMRQHKPPLVTDDILAALVFAVQSSTVSNWFAQFHCMTKFCKYTAESAELLYYLSSLEAALEYLNSASTQLTQILPKELETLELDSLASQICTNCHPLCSCSISQNCALNVDKTSRQLLALSFLGKTAEIERLLFDQNLNLSITDYAGRIPLHFAAKMGHQSTLLALCYSGSNINATDSERWTALHYAASSGHVNCVKALVYYGESTNTRLQVNALTYQGETPLLLAAKWGFIAVVESLLEYGASPSAKTRSGKTAYELTSSSAIREVIGCAARKKEAGRSFEILAPTIHEKVMESPVLSCSEVRRVESSQDVTELAGCTEECDEDLDVKVRNAITNGDVPLLSYYLKFEYRKNLLVRSEERLSSVSSKCHPLCQCDVCYDVVTSRIYLVTKQPVILFDKLLLQDWIAECDKCGQNEIAQLLMQFIPNV